MSENIDNNSEDANCIRGQYLREALSTFETELIW